MKGTHARAVSLAGPLTPLGIHLWTSLFLKDFTLWKRHTVEQFIKNCSPGGGLLWEKFLEDCLLWEGPQAGAGEKCEVSSPEEKGVAEKRDDELTTALIPHPSELIQGRRERQHKYRMAREWIKSSF
ncbi:hypothetical protein HGM15179_011351 [Zosterops borbonicus]|uniref:Uncharacterized protein n=1 Tax=Zosterops borbonicus TaxID=364589 RepID=A0A8K1LJ18_9PASS|nr:hypothetical protein HGM15179_011351 [Zosterops borbonicus]